MSQQNNPVEKALANSKPIELTEEGLPRDKEDLAYLYCLTSVLITLQASLEAFGLDEPTVEGLINPLVVESLADDLYLSLTRSLSPEVLNVVLSLQYSPLVIASQVALERAGGGLGKSIVEEVVRCMGVVAEAEANPETVELEKEPTDSKSSNVVAFSKKLH